MSMVAFSLDKQNFAGIIVYYGSSFEKKISKDRQDSSHHFQQCGERVKIASVDRTSEFLVLSLIPNFICNNRYLLFM